MRRRGAFLLGLWICLSAGCLTGKPVPSASWLPRGWSVAGLDAADVVQMETFLIEGPLGDSYINQELWSLADDQVVSLEHKALLEQNGFRVGQIGGVTPAGLQALIQSKQSCADPRRIQQHAGKPTRLTLGPALPRCRFQAWLGDLPMEADLEQAECTLLVVPTLTPDGRTRLRFTPEVQHGQAAVLPHPTQDRTAWMFQKQQPTESYPTLNWEVTLAPNEYVVMGGRFDRPDTLGHQAFIRAAETPPRQRLLVIRTIRPVTGVANEAASAPENESSAPRSPPLALQAGWTAVKGVAP